MINGEKAKELGIVLDCVEKEQVAESALNIAREIASASSVAVRAVTETLRGQHPDLNKAISREAEVQVLIPNTL